MRKKKYYGVSRSRDKKGKVVKREFRDYTMCIHASVGGCRENMWVLVAEVYKEDDEEKKEKTPRPEGKGWCWDEQNGKWFRIRKLTPRECFRLMDVSDTDFDKLIVTEDVGGKQKRAISDSQLYKMAGNSIVVSCMDLIFENLFFPAKSESTLF